MPRCCVEFPWVTVQMGRDDLTFMHFWRLSWARVWDLGGGKGIWKLKP